MEPVTATRRIELWSNDPAFVDLRDYHEVERRARHQATLAVLVWMIGGVLAWSAVRRGPRRAPRKHAATRRSATRRGRALRAGSRSSGA